MAKYKININRVEYFSGAVIVEAESAKEAREKVGEAWGEALYEYVTDVLDDAQTDFTYTNDGLATEDDIKEFDSLDEYLSD